MIYTEFCAGATLDIQSDCKFNDHLTNEISLIHSSCLSLFLAATLTGVISRPNQNAISITHLLLFFVTKIAVFLSPLRHRSFVVFHSIEIKFVMSIYFDCLRSMMEEDENKKRHKKNADQINLNL